MNICRICETIDNLLCSLNDPVNSIIVEMLTDLANISYSNDDQLPKFLCQKCQKSLKFAIEFKRQCEMTDRKLRRLLEKLLRTTAEETEDVKHFASIDEEFQNYDADAIKVEYLEEELTNNSIDIKEDIFLLQESTEIEDATERKSNIHIFNAMELQKQEPKVFMDKEKCNICKKSFESISGLKRHITRKHTQPKQNQQKEDRSESHHDPNLTCFFCNKMCSSNIHLERHIRKEHFSSEIRTFDCFDCRKEFKNRKNFRSHYENKHSGKSHECHICLKPFTMVVNLRRHLNLVHDGIKKYKCNFCQRYFGRKHNLEDHLTTHSEDRPFKCQECKFACKTAFLLKNHKTNKHSMDTKTKQITKHYSGVSSKMTTICEYCGKDMPKMYYYSHIKRHTGVKPFKCKFCPKNFTTNLGLVNHTYIHTGEYPYKCNVCDRKFRQLTHLNYHTLIHTGEKPHQCTFCSKTFALRSNLTSHTRIHTGETPYHCTECSQQFGELNALKRHKKQYHTK